MKTSRFFKLSAALVAAALVATFAVAPSASAQETPPTAPNAAPKYAVDFSKITGKIKPLNGVNLWTRLSYQRLEDAQPLAEACRFSTVRLHDAPWDNNGLRLVDVHQIFGNLEADPADPKNYFFDATDDYIEAILKGGAQPIYRLGTSIEHTPRGYFAKKPNAEKYAEICAAIVRHYNAGWANGREWNLQYWEIWNEPNLVPQMWDDPDWESYCQFYVVVAKRLRAEFPTIKIGGPALTHADARLIGRLADVCKAEGAPLDFVSWHCYAKGPADVLDPPFAMRKLLDDKGFLNAELHLNEWHYFPIGWDEVHGTKGGAARKREFSTSEDGLHGADAAGFNCFVMSRWQDGPLDMSNYYAFGLHNWGLFDPYGEPRKTYYSMVAFGELAKLSPNRVATVDGGSGSVALLGGIGGDGSSANAEKRLLVSIFKNDAIDAPLEIALAGVPSSGSVDVLQIDCQNAALERQIDYSNGVLQLDAPRSGVYLIRWR